MQVRVFNWVFLLIWSVFLHLRAVLLRLRRACPSPHPVSVLPALPGDDQAQKQNGSTAQIRHPPDGAVPQVSPVRRFIPAALSRLRIAQRRWRAEETVTAPDSAARACLCVSLEAAAARSNIHARSHSGINCSLAWHNRSQIIPPAVNQKCVLGARCAAAAGTARASLWLQGQRGPLSSQTFKL